jgi:hypothetical protein
VVVGGTTLEVDEVVVEVDVVVGTEEVVVVEELIPKRLVSGSRRPPPVLLV